jgi:hypothetical protein
MEAGSFLQCNHLAQQQRGRDGLRCGAVIAAARLGTWLTQSDCAFAGSAQIHSAEHPYNTIDIVGSRLVHISGEEPPYPAGQSYKTMYRKRGAARDAWFDQVFPPPHRSRRQKKKSSPGLCWVHRHRRGCAPWWLTMPGRSVGARGAAASATNGERPRAELCRRQYGGQHAHQRPHGQPHPGHLPRCGLPARG